MSSSSASTLTLSDDAVLNTFIPGYSLLSRFLSYLHIDISAYLPSIIAVLLFIVSLRYILYYVQRYVDANVICTVEINSTEETYSHFMYWVVQQPFAMRTTKLAVSTRTTSKSFDWLYDYEDEGADDALDLVDEYDENGNLLPFNDYWNKVKNSNKCKRLNYTPTEGTHWFRFCNTWLAMTIKRDDHRNSPGWVQLLKPSTLYVSCLGRDSTIIKGAIAEAQRIYATRDQNRTVIFRGQKKPSQPAWRYWKSSPTRPLSTIVLSESKKKSIISDIEGYLGPGKRRWYRGRGIPHRRGYCLYGPPGTGKTSFAFAIAGRLGLPIYLLNIGSTRFNDDDLESLFQDLPQWCIVLLEDIDCAGMTSNRSNKRKPEGNTHNFNLVMEDIGDEFNQQSSISLSALLNAIDGVAASEGRILIMTTNHREKLDESLLRPGRVDMSIEFGHSNMDDIQKLFTIIYSTLEGDVRQPCDCHDGAGSQCKNCTVLSGPHPRLSIEIESQKFAAAIPEDEFTVAEIQGLLLCHKHDPEGAVIAAPGWVEEMRRKKGIKINSARDHTCNLFLRLLRLFSSLGPCKYRI